MEPHPRIRKTIKWGRVLMCLGLGLLVTFATAWGRPIYRGIVWKIQKDGMAFIQEMMAEDSIEPVDDSQRRELVRHRDQFWESWCSIRGRPLESAQPSEPSRYVNAGAAPYWAMHPHDFSDLAGVEGDVVEVKTRGYGLPWRCGRSCLALVHDAGSSRGRSVGWDPFQFLFASLPTSPCWTGLVADVAVWSLSIFALFFGVGAVRRARRGKRGRCVDCNYDRTGLARDAKCPECGAAPASV